MKKLLLVLAAVVMVASGVAMVSAYEAHMVNVTAKVENAMFVAPLVDFGTVFPQEWRIETFDVKVSTSFCEPGQGGRPETVNLISYNLYALPRPGYEYLGDALYIGIDVTDPAQQFPVAAGGLLTPVLTGDPPPVLASDTLSKQTSQWPYDYVDLIVLGLDVPVFQDYYNARTDALVFDFEHGGTKPSGLTEPTVELTGARNVPTGITLGVDIIVQITGFSH